VPEQARTRLARRAVVGAARTLFLEQGYAATTVDAVSKLADVPPATVYRLFGSKLGILEAMLDTSIAGDDEPVPVAARPEVAPLFDEPDPVALLAGFAGVTAAINERTNDVHRVLVSAAGSDPGAAELLAEIRGQRDRGQRQIVRALARRKELRPGLSVREAEDRVHTVMSPEVYRLFVGDRGWSADHYREWLGTALAQQLL
jgi:AcrR family transcriptional regulator